MLIKEVCCECNLTKKAVAYYEKHGLIKPDVMDNGYRSYTDADIAVLKEISVLRKCGIGISDIKSIIGSNNRSASLLRCKYLFDLKIKKMTFVQNCIEELIRNYDIDKQYNSIKIHDDECFTIQEKLVHAFPGNYGLYMAIHFGQFLNERIDSEEKKKAFDAIIEYLDSVDDEMVSELEEYLEGSLSELGETDLDKMNSDMIKAVENYESFLEENEEFLGQYLEYKESSEYLNSPIYKSQQLLLSFQKKSGYAEKFISNLKLLSSSYTEYLYKLDEANSKFFEKFPNAKSIFTNN